MVNSLRTSISQNSQEQFLEFNCISIPEYVFAPVNVSKECSDKVKTYIKNSAKLLRTEPKSATVGFLKALELVSSGHEINEYHYIWALYGLLYIYDEYEDDNNANIEENRIKVSKHLLKFLDNTRNNSERDEELEVFRKEAYRRAGNGLAWRICKDPQSTPNDLLQALKVITDITDCIRDEQDYYIYDTLVQILLRLGKKQEAYALIYLILKETPDFSDFAEFKNDPNYIEWTSVNRTPKT